MPQRKYKIIFLCHGNICRSPMAEYIFKHLCRAAGVAEWFEVSSAAVSTEEIGNDIYPPAKRVLQAHGIPFDRHAAHQITQAEFDEAEYVICADYANIRWLARIVSLDYDIVREPDTSEQVSLLMQWAGEDRDVADPWYTRDFESAYNDIYSACQALLRSFSRDFGDKIKC